MKKCIKCKEEKEDSFFYIAKRNSDILQSKCIDCCKNKKQIGNSLKNYGITRKEYEVMYKDQDYRCKICKRVSKLYVDHNHKTAYIRGLLCITCNLGLGHFQDNPELLKQAVQYLENSPKGIDYTRMFMSL